MTIIAILGWITALLLAFRIKRMEAEWSMSRSAYEAWADCARVVIEDQRGVIEVLKTKRDQLRARLRECEA